MKLVAMDYLQLFSPHNLALISDWLAETGELYVDVYWPHSASSSTAFFVRTMEELKSLIASQTWHEIDITIFRAKQFPLRGIANEQLLHQALQQIVDGQPYNILQFSFYPQNANHYGEGNSHIELRRDFADVLGDFIAIGQEPSIDFDTTFDPNEAFRVSVLISNSYQVVKNQNFYASYADDPDKYEQIVMMWQA